MNDPNQPAPHESEIRALAQAGYRYALSLTHHRQDAEDLVQHACLKILKRHDGLVGRKYLFVTIRNLFIDKGRVRSETQLTETVPDLVADPSPSHVKKVDQRLELKELLAGLRVEEREALYLNCSEGYSAAEIAELTGQPRGTVLSLLSRAKKRLQQQHSSKDWMETK